MDPPTSSTFDAFYAAAQSSALKTVRNSAALPADLAFHRSINPELSKNIDAFSEKVLNLTNRLLALAHTTDSANVRAGKGKARLENQDDFVDSFGGLVVDVVDQLFERTDSCLDEHLGRKKAPAIEINPRVEPKSKSTTRGQLDPGLQHAYALKKPQLRFSRKPDNSEQPWYPTLSHKFNAQIPLGHAYRDSDAMHYDNPPPTTHPYQYEITHTTYPSRMFTTLSPIEPKPFDDTPLNWVATPADFNAMLEKLRNAQEIAVDLEHHNYRTYGGFVCLMQLSTREEDWIVDTLMLREELTELNEVFTDPKIVKVFHGAESDIIWLQQDFNLYIVNLFDTYHASKILEFPRHGLANLLEMYCDFTPDKQYQLADWRIRPLPEAMLNYARSDTHFLLFVYDNLRNALLDRALSRAQSRAQSPHSRSASPLPADVSHALVKEVLSRSQETALRTYTKEVYDFDGTGPGGWETMARKWNKLDLLVDGVEQEVFKAVHYWRDRVAREDDESTRYVLPNHHIFQLAEHPPADMAALLAIFRSVPPVIRRRAKELLEVVRGAVGAYKKRDAPSTSSKKPPPAAPESVPALLSSDGMSSIPTSVTPSLDIWAQRDTKSNIAVSSSLLGTSSKSATKKPSYAASQSSLLGSAFASSSKSTSGSEHYTEVIKRIHDSLVIAPTAPQVASASTASGQAAPSTNAVADAPTDTFTGMQVEVPFVPLAQRKKPASDPVEDTIVVVGQARQKKRKRTKAADGAGEDAGSAKAATAGKASGDKAAVDEAEATPFDFDAVPNILDDRPTQDDAKPRKRKKQAKGPAFTYGDFPAPPKAHSELKSGNQSHTFK
ncbi:hypothetical protein HGRIS_005903 [Hohenbuehelia grisea]|uniref:HRDC domain-containing protein n=1 Tax=Hohenbuehelia grisea TaxID=104357 RepID=A0ABR3JZ54_9AGAR